MRYNVKIHKTSYSVKTITVEATCIEEAESKAITEATNTVFYEQDADYKISFVEKVDLEW